MENTSFLSRIRQSANHLLIGLNIALALALLAVQQLYPNSSVLMFVVALIPMAMSTYYGFKHPQWEPSWHFLTLTNIMFISLIVAALTGHDYQIDMHMYYFSMLALYVFFLHWRVILVAAAAIAIHHLSLNYLLPWMVFPDGTDLARVILHAVPVVAQAAALIWLTKTVSATFESFDAFSHKLKDIAHSLNLTRRIDGGNIPATQQVAESANTLIQTLAGALKDTANIVGVVDKSVVDIHTLNENITQMGHQQREACSSIASALEENSASIEEIDKTASRSKTKVTDANTSVKGVCDLMENLLKNSKQIIDMAAVVSDISEKTKLLALNAAIEASRAGDAGKGFAVVADEVGNLAKNTAKTVDEINTVARLIETNISDTKNSVDALSGDMDEVIEDFSSVAGSLEQQTLAVQEVSNTVVSFSGQVEDLFKNIEKTNTVSEKLTQETHLLQNSIKRFTY